MKNYAEKEVPESDGSQHCDDECEAYSPTVEGYSPKVEGYSPTAEGYTRGEFHEEIRCFRVPHFTVRREYELLREHKQEKFAHLVNRVYDDLFTTYAIGCLRIVFHLPGAAFRISLK